MKDAEGPALPHTSRGGVAQDSESADAARFATSAESPSTERTLPAQARRASVAALSERDAELEVPERRRFERFRLAAAERAERLLKITAAMAHAVSAAEVYEALVDQVASAVEASSTALWLMDEGTRSATLARAVGYGEHTKERLARLALDTSLDLPVMDALRRGEPLWFSSQEELLRHYPHLTVEVSAGRSYHVACLPLISQGRTLGVLGLTIEVAREAAEEERSFLQVVARYAAQAIERLRLFEAERQSRAAADQAALRAEQLYRFAQAAVAAERVEQVLEAALLAIEAALRTQRAAILLCDAAGVMRFRAYRNLSESYRRAVDGHSPWPADAAAPAPVLVPDAEREPQVASYLHVFRSEGIGALAFIPLVSAGRLLGKFMVYYDRPHDFTPPEVETATAIANHLASVIARFSAVARLEETIRHNELVAGVLAHDLRSPLGAIMSAAQLLLMRNEGESDLSDRKAKPITRILTSGQRMAAMIEQLLDFTRARAGGGIEVSARETHLGELLGQALAELELAHPDWRMVPELRGDLNGLWDPDRLLQVLCNLIANAGQHGAGGAITVRLDGADPDTVALEVHNAGAIPEPLRAHIFNPFRSTRQGRGSSGGLGLGLFIVKEIVRAHGGEVSVSSDDDSGTTFSVRLPRKPPQGPRAREEQPTQ